jgi:hypothetical protein
LIERAELVSGEMCVMVCISEEQMSWGKMTEEQRESKGKVEEGQNS